MIWCKAGEERRRNDRRRSTATYRLATCAWMIALDGAAPDTVKLMDACSFGRVVATCRVYLQVADASNNDDKKKKKERKERKKMTKKK